MTDTALDPEMAATVTEIDALGVPAWHTLATEDARRVEDELFSTDAHLPVAQVTDLGFDGPAGRVPVRVYRPETTPAPTLVFFHGGGWQLGTLDSADGICRRLCRRLDAVIVSVDYRLAPEQPFPAAVADAVAAVEWVDGLAGVGGNGRLGVAGTSAGGNLAAAVALAAGDDRALGFDLDTELAVQVLLYPMLAPGFDGASRRDHADGPLLTTRDVDAFWATYLDSPAHAANPYAVPLDAPAEMLAGVPPAVVAVGSHDPLRSEAVAYASRLRDAGVAVDSFVAEGLPHGFCSFADDASEVSTGVAAADRAFDTVVRGVDDRLSGAD